MGLLIPKKELERLNIKENQEVLVEIVKKENPLKELFGFGKNNKITRKEFEEMRKNLEPRL